MGHRVPPVMWHSDMTRHRATLIPAHVAAPAAVSVLFAPWLRSALGASPERRSHTQEGLTKLLQAGAGHHRDLTPRSSELPTPEAWGPWTV